jgi:hypothetical protein
MPIGAKKKYNDILRRIILKAYTSHGCFQLRSEYQRHCRNDGHKASSVTDMLKKLAEKIWLII